MKKTILKVLLATILAGTAWACQDTGKEKSWVMLTTPDKSKLLSVEKLPPPGHPGTTVINVDPEQEYQVMDGFGYTLTGGSAMHIYRMSAESRAALLNELFGTCESCIGVSYLRLSIGASDLDERPFSYAELPDGEVDRELKSFSLEEDRKFLIPVLKEILEVNTDIKLMGSPWSPPKWMKDNNDTRGGSLLPEFYGVYANYLLKYILGMEEEGIHIDAITVQNEPLHPGNNPSLLMLPEDQADFIKNHLGPVFRDAGIGTKIIIYDHNADRPDYPISILDDPGAKQFIDGSAFHLYGGEIEALSQVHEAHPDKHLYFTEQWIGAPGDFQENMNWHMRELVIGASRNWCKTVLEWNLAADPDQQPHTDRGGCTSCLGAITIDGNEVVRNPAYYIIAHASKYVKPGSVRVASDSPDNLPNVAFRTPENDLVVIAMNDSGQEQNFTINFDGKEVATALPPGSTGTFVWERK